MSILTLTDVTIEYRSLTVLKNLSFSVEKGDYFIGILQKLGMEYNEANQIVAALKKAG